MTKLCIFDLDGTVLDTVKTIAYYGNYALSKHGIEPIEVKEYNYFAGNGAVNLIKRALRFRNALTDEVFEKVFADYNTAYNANTSYLTAPFDGIKETLDALKARGIKMAILSNKPHFATCGVITELFGEGYFNCVYGQREGVPIKPDPTAVLGILQELDAQPEECLYVGDTGTDMKTGKNAGLPTVGVTWGFRGKEELLEGGADVIIDEPRQLLDCITI
ncbi:MAG: HAD family hydrolase [Ruminococcaceae bacterium]|nr:HAD family hydrolase [Oscillospiraceae bacterium]